MLHQTVPITSTIKEAALARSSSSPNCPQIRKRQRRRQQQQHRRYRSNSKIIIPSPLIMLLSVLSLKHYSTRTTTTAFTILSKTLSPHHHHHHHHRRLFSTMPATHTDTSTPSPTTYTMTEAQRYFFDLNGYLIIRNVLTPTDIQSANAAISKHLTSHLIPRTPPPLRNANPNTIFSGTGPPRGDLGGVFEWDASSSRVFKSILAHPKLLPLYHGLLGPGYRMDHHPFVITSDNGGEGFRLHGGTIDCESGEYNHFLAYGCHNGVIRNMLLGVNVMLVDHDEGCGGFCVVPGSHKSCFKMPEGMVDGECEEMLRGVIVQPETKAGDVVLFSEGTVHGALPWTASYQRRSCLYRFAPATNAYGRSYFGDNNDDQQQQQQRWPKKFYDDLTEAQKSVLEPPYANRLDRPNIVQNETTGDLDVIITTRNEVKKEHDKNVFGTKYF